MHKFGVGNIVWALSKDGKAITRTKIEAVLITITKSDTSVSYKLITGTHVWGHDVPESRVFPNHVEARAALDKATKHG